MKISSLKSVTIEFIVPRFAAKVVNSATVMSTWKHKNEKFPIFHDHFLKSDRQEGEGEGLQTISVSQKNLQRNTNLTFSSEWVPSTFFQEPSNFFI